MKYLVLSASVVVQVCLGGLYAWSAFVPALKSDYGLSTAQTQFIFGALIAVFTVTMVFAGRLLEKTGPRPLLILSGLLFAAGYGTAALSGGRFPLMLLGVGGIVGAATGMGYVCPLSVCMRWFPEHKGLVTGVAVAGFGGGAVLLASIVEPLLVGGADVLRVFLWVGLAYGATVLVAGLAVAFPPGCHGRSAPAVSPEEARPVARDPYFWALVAAMFAGTFAGLLVIGNLTPIARNAGVSQAWAAVGISAFAVGNAAGRVTWGRLVDVMHGRAVRNSLLVLAAAVAGLWAASSMAPAFVALSFLAGFAFGACFVIHAALVATRYGVLRVGGVYPLVFLAYGAAGLAGPAIGGALYDATGRYASAFVTSLAVIAAGLALSGLLFRRASQQEPGAEESGTPD